MLPYPIGGNALFLFLTVALPGVLACAGGSSLSTVRGIVTYRERIAMPPGAVLEVSLEDVSRADAPATVLGNVAIEDPGNVPVAFEIPYDPNDIDEQRSYAVRARILVDGRPRWVSDTAQPVLTRGNDEQVDVMLTAAGDADDAMDREPAGAAAALTGTRWKLTHLGDRAVVAANAEREPYLIFDAEGRVGGSGGCNHIGGNYEVDGSTIAIRDVLSTMMACMDGMETETDFLAALEQVRSWRLEGPHLELSDAAGALLARFDATQPN